MSSLHHMKTGYSFKLAVQKGFIREPFLHYIAPCIVFKKRTNSTTEEDKAEEEEKEEEEDKASEDP